MHRFRRISATPQTLRAQLFPSEEVLEQQDGVGLYDGKDKDEAHGDGRMVLTTHRLVYLDSSDPHRRSCYLDLALVRQTEYWAGFLKSSAKITLLLGDAATSSSSPSPVPASGPSAPTSVPTQQEADTSLSFLHPGSSSWTCHICGFSNPPRPACGLCGVKRDAEAAAAQQRRSQSAAASVAGASVSNGIGGLSIGRSDSVNGFPARPKTTDIAPPPTTKEIPCSTCTFLNHPSMFRCEMCDSPLGTPSSSSSSSASPSPSIIRPTPIRDSPLRPTSAPVSGRTDPATPTHSRAATPAPPSNFPANAYVRLSFRRGGDKVFYASLKRALFAKGWDDAAPPSTGGNRSGASNAAMAVGGSTEEVKVIGIDGILRTMDWKEQARQGEMEEGLRDLQALMSKAKEMVQMAQSLNAKLTQAQQQQPSDPSDPSNPTSSSSATVIRSSLVSLGISLEGPAVTPDMVASDLAYERELARELGGLLLGFSSTGSLGKRRRAIMRDGQPDDDKDGDGTRGLIGLDEVWCIWNRSRGVSLVSPSELLSACPHLPDFTRPLGTELSLHRFRSGLLALATPYFSTRSFGERMILRLLEGGTDGTGQKGYRERGVGVIEVAKEEKIGIGLAGELCEAFEMAPSAAEDLGLPWKGAAVVRDEQVAGVGGGAGKGTTRWWINEMAAFEWDDPNAGKQVGLAASLL